MEYHKNFNHCGLWLSLVLCVICFTTCATCTLRLFPKVSSSQDDVKFYYYSAPGVRYEVRFNDTLTLSRAALKEGASTVILIDGFNSNSSTTLHQYLTNGFLSQKKRQNVFVVDYERLSGRDVMIAGGISSQRTQARGQSVATLLYLQILRNVDPVASRVADFLNFLRSNQKLSFPTVHIVGMSLGAHIGGAAGTYVNQRYGSMIGRVTGLDPAFTFFPFKNIKKVRRNSGSFVDIYHTNRGTLGEIQEGTGHINVYVNNANNQPGCDQLDITGFPGYCSHTYAWKLFFTSFSRDFKACPCYGYDCLCRSNCKVDTCLNPISVLSQLSGRDYRGTFHLSVNDPLF